ncbi:6-phosphogluconolactonase [bacterium]|nr:6-phosphogluconolactonase [bacterium]
MKIEKFYNEKDFLKSAVDSIKKVIAETENICRIALSGGSTPGPLYKVLSGEDLVDFSKVEFYQVDERYVNRNNENSNYRLINQLLVEPLGDKLKDFYYFNTDLSIEECIKDYSDKIRPIKFDLTILGMGTDGHIASLFPGNTEDLDNQNPALYTETKKFAIHDRLTISLKKIQESKNILLLLKDKKIVLDELLNSKKSIYEMPAKGILDNENLNIYLFL